MSGKIQKAEVSEKMRMATGPSHCLHARNLPKEGIPLP